MPKKLKSKPIFITEDHLSSATISVAVAGTGIGAQYWFSTVYWEVSLPIAKFTGFVDAWMFVQSPQSIVWSSPAETPNPHPSWENNEGVNKSENIVNI